MGSGSGQEAALEGADALLPLKQMNEMNLNQMQTENLESLGEVSVETDVLSDLEMMSTQKYSFSDITLVFTSGVLATLGLFGLSLKFLRNRNNNHNSNLNGDEHAPLNSLL